MESLKLIVQHAKHIDLQHKIMYDGTEKTIYETLFRQFMKKNIRDYDEWLQLTKMLFEKYEHQIDVHKPFEK